MKGFRAVLWILMTTLLLAMPESAGAQSQPQPRQKQKLHRHTGDIWVGCVKNAPATAPIEAFNSALFIGNKEGRSCWVDERRRWLLFHWTARMTGAVVIRKAPVTTTTKGTDHVGP